MSGTHGLDPNEMRRLLMFEIQPDLREVEAEIALLQRMKADLEDWLTRHAMIRPRARARTARMALDRVELSNARIPSGLPVVLNPLPGGRSASSRLRR